MSVKSGPLELSFDKDKGDGAVFFTAAILQEHFAMLAGSWGDAGLSLTGLSSKDLLENL